MKTCPNCGQALADDLSFCTSCGTKLTSDSTSNESKTDAIKKPKTISVKVKPKQPNDNGSFSEEIQSSGQAPKTEALEKDAKPIIKPLWMVLGGLLLIGILIGVITANTNHKSDDEDHSSDSDNSITVYMDGYETTNKKIEKTKDSMKPYWAILGQTVDSNNNLDVGQEIIDNMDSVYLMGKTGSVSHGLSASSISTIDILEWTSNDSVSRSEFESFLDLLDSLFDQEKTLKSYENYSDETYVWVDYDNASHVICWYEDGYIRVNWFYDLYSDSQPTSSTTSATTYTTSFSSSIHKCITCGKDAEYSIKGITGQTEYYCYEHYKDLLQLYHSLASS